MSIQAEHGQEIFNEVGRAWLESQDLSDATGGVQVPCDNKKKRLLENDEIIMRLTAKCMVLSGQKPSAIDVTSSSDVSKRKRKFRKIFEEVKKQEDEGGPEEEALSEARNITARGC